MNVSELMKRPYHIVLVRDEASDGQVGWVATVAELPGCLSQGDTPAQAAEHIQDAMRMWLQSAIDEHDVIPDPVEVEYPPLPAKGYSTEMPRFVEREQPATTPGDARGDYSAPIPAREFAHR